ncbi:MAG: methyl-accepting chemotaxis protein [Oscillospiraceae bacterium]|nr:methyl-accepting chemotaxis protein [Oscillospiraceae bacterium]
MGNMKTSVKLIISFGIIIFMLGIVGGFGIYGMNVIKNGTSDMYEHNVTAIEAVGHMEAQFLETRVYIRDIINYETDTDYYKTAVAQLNKADTEFHDSASKYEKTLVGDFERGKYNAIMSSWSEWQTFLDHCRGLATDNKRDEARDYLTNTGYPISVKLGDLLDECTVYNEKSADDKIADAVLVYKILLAVIVVMLFVSIITGFSFANYLSGCIAKPLSVLAGFMRRAGDTGNIAPTQQEANALNRYNNLKDEVGSTIKDIDHFLAHIRHIAAELNRLAEGDLTTDIEVVSDTDIMGKSVKNLSDSLNNIFREMSIASSQVAVGASQVSEGAQSLASGSTEQAATVEELSGSVNEISGVTRQNVEGAGRAAELVGMVKTKAETGSSQMAEMMTAVREIDEASQSISRVIKVIDDIAFQTNILALNAAVEAARAGQHGKGFAVVAEEVRNLAAKSSEAAHDTEELIANSITKSQLGARIAADTETSLSEIVAGIQQSTELIMEISKSLNEQAGGIYQINTAIDQVAQVVQTNSATSEQSAAASEQLSGQARMLEELVSAFRLRE